MESTVKVNPQIKTIKFEARPMWETAIYAKKFSGDSSMDAKRKENYEKAKNILDNHARTVISLATRILVAEDLTPTYEKLKRLYWETKNNRNKDAMLRYERAVKDFKNHIVEIIKLYGTEKQLIKSQGDLFSDKKSCLLNDTSTLRLSEEEKDVIRLYYGFTSYFTKYFDSLSKTIFCGTEHGSVANRIIKNMEKYFKNEVILSNIKEEHPDLYDYIKSNVDKMDVTLCISQEGIDTYNMFLGDINNNGINSIINEYRMKHKVQVSGLKQLDKIPLCKVEKQIVVHSIESEQELVDIMNHSFDIAANLILFAKDIVKTLFSDEDMKRIYVKESSIANTSMNVYGKWDSLLKNLKSYYAMQNKTMEENISLYDLEEAIKYNHIDFAANKSIVNYIKDKMLEVIIAEKDILDLKKRNNVTSVVKNKIAIKNFYEKMLLIKQTLRIFDLDKVETTFVENIVSMQDKMQEMNTIYNMVRNFYTKSPIKKNSYPVYFNKSSCLNSLDYDKFNDGISLSSILRKDEHYYLLILNPEYSTKLPIKAKTAEGGYEQLVYKQLTGLNKMFPKVFLSKGNYEVYNPTERIIEIVQKKLYTKEAGNRESCVEWIRFCIESFKKNKEWMKNFHPKFKEPEEYSSANEFYTELERYTIRMDFSERIDETYLRKAVEEGKMFLFEIYSKDFSPYHHGKDSSFTKLLKEVFSDENLNKINHSDETAIKLASGGSELTFRKASLPYKETHMANIPIVNKNPLNNKKESVFTYALCKDKRFMTDKYLLTLAVQIGFRNEEISKYELNKKVNEKVLKEMPNVLTIRAGERHLLYYIVTDPNGNILEQDSLNIIHSKNDKQEVVTNYKEILNKRENEIMEAKENWDYSKDIKTIKEGYMSQALHIIVKLQEKYNAIIFVEDYSGSFVQGRMANMKNIYQQFQKALLQKLTCYVPEGKTYNEAIQLASPVSSLDDLKGQSGIVYFVNPSYTSNMDPTTGFVNQYYENFRYESIKKAKETLSKITDIQYNEKENDFEIVISEKEFNVSDSNKTWILHTKGIRNVYKDKKYQAYECTENMKKLFKEYSIAEFSDMRSKEFNKKFYEKLFEIILIILQMHYFDKDLEEEYMLSPIKNLNNICFDSRSAKNNQLRCSAAIKTYLIYKKGFRDLLNINQETLLIERDEKGTHKEKWIKYLQNSIA